MATMTEGKWNPSKGYFNYNPGDLTTKRGLGRAASAGYFNNLQQEQGAMGRRGEQYGVLFPGYSEMVAGGSAADNNALEQSVLTPLGGAYDQARQAASRHQAATRNTAGYGSFLGELARGQSRDYASAGMDIANEKFNRKMAGLQGIQQLYGIDTSFLESLGQQQQGILGLGSAVQSRRGSLFKDIMGAAGTIGNGIAGAF